MKEKIKGTAKKIGAALSGDAGILNTLQGEHAEVASLMDDIMDADSHEAAAEEHYPTMREKLLLHARAEERVLYAACERYPETAEMIPDSRAEHGEMEQLLEELDSMPIDAPAWMERFTMLQKTVLEHVQEEEDVLFQRCTETFENDELRELDDDYDAAKEDLRPAIGKISLERSDTPRPSAS